MSLRPPFAAHAVVFDLDGVLVDSEGLWARAEAQVAAELGGAWSPGLQHEMLGQGPREAAKVLAERLGAEDTAEVERRLLAAASEVFQGAVAAREGARELVEALTGRVALAVATNSRRALAHVSLRSAGFAAFDVVISADEAAEAKPAPAPYLQACAALGVEPARSVCVEDSPVGARSARAAGLWVIGCPALPETRIDAAHALVRDLAEIDVEALVGGDRPQVG